MLRVAVQGNFFWEFMAGEDHTHVWRHAHPGNPDILLAYLDRYGTDILILDTRELSALDFFRRKGWKAVHLDNTNTVLLRHVPAGMPVYLALRVSVQGVARPGDPRRQSICLFLRRVQLLPDRSNVRGSAASCNFSGPSSRLLVYSRCSSYRNSTLTNVALPWHKHQRGGGNRR